MHSHFFFLSLSLLNLIVHNIIFNVVTLHFLQVLKVEELARGCLELGFNIKISPGRLAKYTKVCGVYVRLCVCVCVCVRERVRLCVSRMV